MATIPAPMGMSGPARPAGGPSASGPLPVVSIDPLKLLLKYKWILAAAFIGGAVIGGGAHFAWLLTWPYFRSNVLFQTYVQVAELDKLTGYGQVDDAELDKYMQTQTKLMTSAGVLQRVAEDPRLPQEAPKWAKWRMEDGKFNTVEALIDLQDTVSARVVPQTRLIDLSFTYRDKAEAKAIVGLVRDAYQRTIADSTRAANRQQRDALTKTIAEMQSQIEAVQGQRERLMKDVSYTNLNRLSNETSEALRVVNQERVKVGLDIESFTVRLKELEAELQNPAGPSYTDQLRDVVENDTLMLSLANQINDLESGLRGLKLRFTDEHRDVKQYKAMIDAAKSQQESERQRLLRQKFDAEVDSVRKAVSQLQAQDSDLAAKQERYSVRLAELTQAEATIDDMDEQAKRLIQERTVMQSSLQTVNALESLDTNKRILVLQEERLPDEVTFPKLKIMVPAGAIVVFGLVLGVLVLREMVDQRVKGPADVAIIPKARIVGIVPDAHEDPEEPGVLETCFIKHERGVMAESFRQVRAAVLKRLEPAGHRALLVVGGLPESGSTTVASNLALALAASDKRVLLIDANMRRPSLHKVYQFTEGPGLGEVLAGSHTLEGVVHKVDAEPRVHVMTAGERPSRVFERLATNAMGDVLRQAKEKYDYVVVDCSPLGVSGDGLTLASKCDASMLVVRALSEKRGMVARLRNELGDTRSDFLGVLINGVQGTAGGYMRSNIIATHEYQTQDRDAA
jgi:succinoglycan biosynthesis transport protein ExoP